MMIYLIYIPIVIVNGSILQKIIIPNDIPVFRVDATFLIVTLVFMICLDRDQYFVTQEYEIAHFKVKLKVPLLVIEVEGC